MTHYQPEKLPMPDADVVLYRQFFTPEASDDLLQALTNDIDWKQESIRVPGKIVPLPRLTAWYGDEGMVYRWSGITQHPLAWTPLLMKIKQAVENAAQTHFNSVLLNLYRIGQDSVSWHSDDEPELDPVIASLSFGAVRQFQFKRIDDPKQRLSIELPHGSLLIMGGTTQQYWRHRIPKSNVVQTPRINLTFRTIHPS
jgi:alkylated DNA repair dioxygenase AlkB